MKPEFTTNDYDELFDECYRENAYHKALYCIIESVFERLGEVERPTYDDAYKAAMEQLDNEVTYYSDCENIIVAHGLSNAFSDWNDYVFEMCCEVEIDLTSLARAVLYMNLPNLDDVIDLYMEKLEEQEEEEE